MKRICRLTEIALREECEALGIPPGRVEPGTGHNMYIFEIDGKPMRIPFANSPKNEGDSINSSRRAFRRAVRNVR